MNTRVLVALLYASAIFSLDALILSSLVDTFVPGHWVLLVGIWLFIMGISYSSFIIYVPPVTGWVTHNKFKSSKDVNHLNSFGPGYHIKYPWETVAESFSLKTETKSFEKYYDAQDGPEMKFSCTYSYKPAKDRLRKFIMVDSSTIEKAITGGVSAIASRFISKRNAVSARGAVGAAGKEILANFEKMTEVQTTEGDKKIEEAFGIDVVMIRVDDIEYSESFREAKAASAQAEEIKQAAQKYKMDKSVTGKDALNFTLVQEGKAKKQIIDLEGIDTAGLADFLKKVTKGGK